MFRGLFVWGTLSREAIKDVFLELVDPLDQVVNEMSKKPRSLAGMCRGVLRPAKPTMPRLETRNPSLSRLGR